jgi:16S rRNA (guanine527-N7)-methyltransferase
MATSCTHGEPALAIAGPADFATAFAVSRETMVRLATYEKLLRQWQKAVNLVATRSLDDVWQRHFADSAQLLRLAPSARSWIDLGSGGGFPGLVLAILLAERAASTPDSATERGQDGPAQVRLPGPDGAPRPAAGSVLTQPALPVRVALIESDTRKSAFLREVARQTGIAVDILSTRIESAATQSKLQAPDVVTARALAPLDKLLHLAAPLSSPRTVGLFLKGREAAKEVEAARKMWVFNSELIPSRTEAGAHIVRVGALGPKRKEPRS